MRYLFIFLVFVASSASAQIINTINIAGNQTIDRGTILNYMPFGAGDFYNTESRNIIYEQLIQTGFFKEVLINDKDDTLTIEVVENPIIRSIKIKMDGTDLIKEDKLKEILKNLEIIEGRIYNERAFINFIDEVKKTYETGGYSKATVEHDVATSTDNLVTISLNLAENNATKIDSIVISGNNAFADDELLDVFTIGEADFFLINYFTNKDRFSEIELDSSLDVLSNFYVNNGYLDFEIKDIDIQDKNKKIVITIVVEEGIQYTLGDVEFNGTDSNVESLFSMQNGEVFERQKILELVQDISDYYTNQGYAFVEVNTDTQKKGNSIDLTVNIKQNQKVYINRISISGNTSTSDSVIRREIDLLEGGLYNNTELDESISRINRLGFFKNVDMNVSRVAGNPDRINLHFEVEENKTGRFSVGISHSNNTGIAFSTRVSESNIFGTGNSLNAQLTFSKAVREVDISFLNPSFNNKNHSISYGVFYKSVDASKLKIADYSVDRKGINIGYGVPLSETSRLSFENRLSFIDVKCGTTFKTVDYEAVQCADKADSELLTSLTWSDNTLNNFYFPTQGRNARVRLGVALPILDYRYYKIDASYDKYFDLQNDVTFKLRGVLGFASGLGSKKLPFFERYYTGGASSLRGFSFNSIGSKYPNGTVRGGEANVLGSAAIVAPIPALENNEQIRVSAFIDAGSVYDKIKDFNGSNLRASAGVGFIWITPIGPLGLYLAKPLKKKTGDSLKTFDFSLGTIF